MQVKLWIEIEKALKEMAELPENKALKLSISTLANSALAAFISNQKAKKTK